MLQVPRPGGAPLARRPHCRRGGAARLPFKEAADEVTAAWPAPGIAVALLADDEGRKAASPQPPALKLRPGTCCPDEQAASPGGCAP